MNMSLSANVKTFALRFGLFSIPVLILLGALEYQQHVLPNNYQAKEEYLLAIQDSIHTISLGNSQSYMGVNPWVMKQPAFNLSNTAQMLTYDYELLQKYHHQLPRLKRVLLGISVPSLYTVGNDLPGDFNRTYHYKHYLGISTEANPFKTRYYSIVNNISIKKSVDRMVDFYTGADDLVEFDSLGWYTDPVQRDLIQNGIDAAASHNTYMKWENKAHNLNQLNKIVELCESNGYDLVIFSPPMYESYRENMAKEYYEDMVLSLDSLAEKHTIPYQNFTFDDSFTAEDYFDSNHLREQGSLKLTAVLEQL